MVNETPVHPAVQGCVHVLERCELLLNRLSDSLYTTREGREDSIGAHLRHGIEHITCFLEGVDAGLIDYDLRRRDGGIETDKSKALDAINLTRTKLLELNPEILENSITVKQIPGPGHPPKEIPSSVERELVFMSNHMIHHLSVIYIHCNHAGVELPKNFPLALSTIVYRNVVVG